MSSPVAPFAVMRGEGTSLPIPFGGSVTIKAHTRNTNGSLTVLEFVHPPKAGPALHTHFREDEVWYVLEGDYRFKVGEAMFRVSEGGMAFGPRGAARLPEHRRHTWPVAGHRHALGAWSGSSSSAPSCYLARWIPRRSPPLRLPTGLSQPTHRSGFPIRASTPYRGGSPACRPRPVIPGRATHGPQAASAHGYQHALTHMDQTRPDFRALQPRSSRGVTVCSRPPC